MQRTTLNWRVHGILATETQTGPRGGIRKAWRPGVVRRETYSLDSEEQYLDVETFLTQWEAANKCRYLAEQCRAAEAVGEFIRS